MIHEKITGAITVLGTLAGKVSDEDWEVLRLARAELADAAGAAREMEGSRPLPSFANWGRSGAGSISAEERAILAGVEEIAEELRGRQDGGPGLSRPEGDGLQGGLCPPTQTSPTGRGHTGSKPRPSSKGGRHD